MEENNKIVSQIDEEEKPPSSKNPLPGNLNFPKEKGFLSFYPHYFKRSLSENLQNFYLNNGHLVLVKSLNIEAITDMERCRQLWEEFSPQRTLFDTWQFRYAFWKGYHYVPYFLLLKNGEDLGLLPLQYEEDKKGFYWFGSDWQEENTLFVKDPIFVPLLLAACPKPATLNAINLETVSWAKEYMEFKQEDSKYILDLREIHTLDDYLAIFTKKTRYNLKRDRRLIKEQNPEVIFNRFEDLDHLINLCKKRMHEKGSCTDWEDPRRVETFRQVIELGKLDKSYEIRMITVKIDGVVASVDLITLMNGTYAPIKCGYNVADFPGIGNFVNLLEIEDALSLGMKKLDFLQFSYGWKDRLFDAIPLFRYEK